MKHLNITITGRVQGVFFRAATKEMANNLGIAGFVRNERDGSVYAEAEGEENELQSFIEWLKKGPPGAAVENVATESDAPENYTDFKIRH